MVTHKSEKNNSGFALLEIVVGAAIIFISTFALMLTASSMTRINANTYREVKAAFLLEEGIEALRFIRDDGWGNLATIPLDTDYFISFDAINSKWATTTTEELIDGEHYRRFVVSEVLRDVSDDITLDTFLGTPDTDILRFTIRVEWQNSSGATSTREAISYLSNFFNE